MLVQKLQQTNCLHAVLSTLEHHLSKNSSPFRRSYGLFLIHLQASSYAAIRIGYPKSNRPSHLNGKPFVQEGRLFQWYWVPALATKQSEDSAFSTYCLPAKYRAIRNSCRQHPVKTLPRRPSTNVAVVVDILLGVIEPTSSFPSPSNAKYAIKFDFAIVPGSIFPSSDHHYPFYRM